MQKRVSAIAQRAVADPLAPLFSKILGKLAANPDDFIALAVGSPDNSLLPVELTRTLINKVLDDFGGKALNYTRPEGLPPYLQAYIRSMEGQGVVFDPKIHDALATSGGMEAISMASEMLVDPGDTILIEGPAYAGAVSVFKLWGASVRHVACDQDGMLPQALETAIKQYQPKLVLLMPDGQNPSGMTMPLGRRKQITDILRKYDIWAIEDSAYSRLVYDGGVLPTLQSLLPEKVLLANSVSKFLFPAARLGILIAPKETISVAASIKSAYNMQASGLIQAVAAEYLNPDNPYLDEYVPALLKTYRERRDAMAAALDKYFKDKAGYKWAVPKAGMFLWLEGPKDINFTRLIDKAIDNGVAYVPGSMFYGDDKSGHNCARLNFASTPVEKIDEGIKRLAKTIL